MRTFLILPDLNDAALDRWLTCGADVLVLDLVELTDLAQATTLIRSLVSRHPRPRVYARIPALEQANAIAVLDASIGAGIDGIVLPETLGGHDVTRLDARISVEEAVHAIDHGCVRIIAEAASSARAVLGLPSIRGASHRLEGLIWSPGRLAADMGHISVRTTDGQLRAPIAVALGQFLIATYAAGVMAILDATEGPAQDCLSEATANGFGGIMSRDLVAASA